MSSQTVTSMLPQGVSEFQRRKQLISIIRCIVILGWPSIRDFSDLFLTNGYINAETRSIRVSTEKTINIYNSSHCYSRMTVNSWFQCVRFMSYVFQDDNRKSHLFLVTKWDLWPHSDSFSISVHYGQNATFSLHEGNVESQMCIWVILCSHFVHILVIMGDFIFCIKRTYRGKSFYW